nr:hypothetical protein [Mycoplasmopsis bovis]
MKYRPIHNRETMEIVQSNRDVSIIATEAKKTYRDHNESIIRLGCTK